MPPDGGTCSSPTSTSIRSCISSCPSAVVKIAFCRRRNVNSARRLKRNRGRVPARPPQLGGAMSPYPGLQVMGHAFRQPLIIKHGSEFAVRSNSFRTFSSRSRINVGLSASTFAALAWLRMAAASSRRTIRFASAAFLASATLFISYLNSPSRMMAFTPTEMFVDQAHLPITAWPVRTQPLRHHCRLQCVQVPCAHNRFARRTVLHD